MYIVHSTGPPSSVAVLELVLVADACRRAGASRITAVTPYLGYSRQDRRASGREPISARVVAGMFETVGIDAVVVVDLHSPAVSGFFSAVVVNLTAVPAIAAALRDSKATVVVSPDFGAVDLAAGYAQVLGLPIAVVRKKRISGTEVDVTSIDGDVKGQFPLIVDDMVSTGGTIEAAARALVDAGCRPEMIVAATHGVLAGRVADRLAAVPVQRYCFTNSLERAGRSGLPVEEIDLSPVLADAVRRMHEGKSLDGLISYS